MTSKSLFFSRMKEDRKRRLWAIVLFVCVCFLFTVGMELMLENAANLLQNQTISLKEFGKEVTGMVGRSTDWFYLMLGTGAALLFGFQGFYWLTLKQQADFYHSLPVKRTERFLTIYFNGILFFLIPLLIHEVILAALIGARGMLTVQNIICMMKNLSICLLTFLLIYHLAILAVMMTGNLIVSLIAAVAFLFYANALSLVLTWHYETYFDNYAYSSTSFSWLSYLSPISRVFRVLQIFRIGGKKEAVMAVVYLLVMAATVFLLSWKLYLMRPMERAGKALIFPKTGNVIRVLIVVPVSMVAGMMFSVMTGSGSIVWAYLGGIIGAVFGHGFMEVIFQFDIRAAFRKKRQLLGTIVLTLAIITVFQFDLFGYDSYLPKEANIKTIDFSVDDDQMGYTEELIVDEDGTTQTYSYSKYVNHIEDGEMVTQFYDLIKTGLAKESDRENGYANITVCYQLKNGKSVYRDYVISTAVMLEKFTPIYQSETGKAALYPEMQLSAKNLEKIECITPFSDKTVELSQEEKEQLLSAVKKDIQAKTYQQYLEEITLGSLELTYKSEKRSTTMLIPISVTDTSENTLAYLEEKGIYMELPNPDVEIEEIKVYQRSEDELVYEDDGTQVAVTEGQRISDIWDEDGTVILTQKQQESILPVMMASEYNTYQTMKIKSFTYSLDVTVKNKKTGDVKTIEYIMAEEDAPDFLK